MVNENVDKGMLEYNLHRGYGQGSQEIVSPFASQL